MRAFNSRLVEDERERERETERERDPSSWAKDLMVGSATCCASPLVISEATRSHECNHNVNPKLLQIQQSSYSSM